MCSTQEINIFRFPGKWYSLCVPVHLLVCVYLLLNSNTIYFRFKYDLGREYYPPKVRSNWGSNSWPQDHDSTFRVTEMPTLTTRPSVTYKYHPLKYLLSSLKLIKVNLNLKLSKCMYDLQTYSSSRPRLATIDLQESLVPEFMVEAICHCMLLLYLDVMNLIIPIL